MITNFKFNNEQVLKFTLTIILSLGIMFNGGIDSQIIYFNLLFTSIVFLLLLQKNGTYFTNKSINIFLVFSIFAFLSILWSVHTLRTIIESIHLFYLVIVLLFALQVKKKNYYKIIKLLIVISLFISFVGVLQYLFNLETRVNSIFDNPNPFGLFMSIMFILSIGYYFMKKEKKLYVFAIIFLTTLLLTGSKGSMIALIISMFFYFLKIKKNTRIYKLKKMIIAFIASYILYQILFFTRSLLNQFVLESRFLLEDMIRKDSIVSSSINGRLEFWKIAFELFLDKPIGGYGLGTYFTGYNLKYPLNQWFSRFTHNHYLQIFSELGLIGIISFVYFIFESVIKSYFKRFEKYNEESIVLMVGVIVFLLHIGIDFTWNFTGVTALVFFLISYNLNRDKKYKYSKKIVLSFSIIMILVILFVGSLNYTQLIIKEYKENPDFSISMIEKMNKFFPINPYSFYTESNWKFKRFKKEKNIKDLNDSKEKIKKAINLAPYNPNFNLHLAKIYKFEDKYDNALKFYKNTSKYGTYHLEYKIILSNFYSEIGYNEKEISVLEDAKKIIQTDLKKSSDNKKPIVLLNSNYIYDKLLNHYKSVEETTKVKSIKQEYNDFIDRYELKKNKSSTNELTN